MASASPDLPSPSFLERLRNAGVEPGDSEELRLNKQLLFFATGLVSAASMLWLAIYWAIGPQFSATLPYAFQLVLAGNLALYIRLRNFDFFRLSQLALFLFAPFVMQWSIGNFITGSGIILWGLLAPFGAILFFGVRESVAWFFAWVFFTALTGVFDFLLADAYAAQQLAIPLRTSMVFFALNFIAVATIIYVLLRYSIQEKRKIQKRLEEAHWHLVAEQYRSEKLLLNILPAPVAERLKNAEQTIADGFPAATVMFADLVNFTRVAASMTPEQVFGMLNSIFSAFDDLCERLGLEKIKTIGDAYMAAGGLNSTSSDPAAAIADFALAMQTTLHRDYQVNAAHMEIRIGISTGPVVAGVVGKHKFIYDVWGDTVNLASRITSEGAPGTIHCDAATQSHLADRFDFEGPQRINLKGKGEMTVYRLTGRKAIH
jgi:adenylate cyclase